ncbi:HAD family hydrolase [Flavobacteriaceae bacterium LMO-SS05]
MINTLIFDFGNVFLNLDLEKAKHDTLSLFGIETLSDDMVAINCLYEQGLITSDEFVEFYLDNVPNLTKADVIQLWNAVLKDFPEHRLQFIQKLASEKKYKLILLSNTNELHINWIKEHIPFYEDFKACFDAFYLSHEIGLRKPDKAIFDFVLNENQLKAKDCLFIDDSKEHTQSAAQLGIPTWNLNPKTDDITDLFTTKNHLF